MFSRKAPGYCIRARALELADRTGLALRRQLDDSKVSDSETVEKLLHAHLRFLVSNKVVTPLPPQNTAVALPSVRLILNPLNG